MEQLNKGDKIYCIKGNNHKYRYYTMFNYVGYVTNNLQNFRSREQNVHSANIFQDIDILCVG